MLNITDIREEKDPDTLVLFREVRRKKMPVIEIPVSIIKDLQTQAYFLKREANREYNPERKIAAETAAAAYEYILGKLGCNSNEIDELHFTECNWTFVR